MSWLTVNRLTAHHHRCPRTIQVFDMLFVVDLLCGYAELWPLISVVHRKLSFRMYIRYTHQCKIIKKIRRDWQWKFLSVFSLYVHPWNYMLGESKNKTSSLQFMVSFFWIVFSSVFDKFSEVLTLRNEVGSSTCWVVCIELQVIGMLCLLLDSAASDTVCFARPYWGDSHTIVWIIGTNGFHRRLIFILL